MEKSNWKNTFAKRFLMCHLHFRYYKMAPNYMGLYLFCKVIFNGMLYVAPYSCKVIDVDIDVNCLKYAKKTCDAYNY